MNTTQPSRSDLFAYKAVLGRVWARFSEQQTRIMAHFDSREPLSEGRAEAVKRWLWLALLHRWMRDFAIEEADGVPEVEPDETPASDASPEPSAQADAFPSAGVGHGVKEDESDELAGSYGMHCDAESLA